MGENQGNNIEDLFKAIYNDSPIGIELYNSKGKLIDLNQSCLELFGVSSKDQVAGFDLLNDPNIPKEYLTKLKQRETVRFESVFDFDLVKEQKLYKTALVGKIYLDVLITPLFLGENGTISNYLVHVQDISDRKIGEHRLIDLNEELEKRVQKRTKQLRKSEENWRFLVEEAPDIIFTVDRKRRILYINKVPKGITTEQTIGTDVLDYVNPEYHKNVKNSIEKVFQTGESDYYEISARGPDGINSWYSTRLGAIKQNEEIVSVMLITRDISERKNMELKLKESEEKFRSIAELSLMGITIVQDNRIKYINQQAAHMMGYSVEEMLNWDFKKILKCILPDDLGLVMENMKKVLTNSPNALNRLEYRILKKSGEILWVENFGSQIQYEGKLAQVITSLDITEKKLSEEKLQEEKEKVETYLNLVNVIVVALDRDGTISLINKKGNEILGWNEGELIGKNWFENCLPSQDKKRVYNYFKKLIEEELDIVPFYENLLITKKGEKKLIAWSTILFKDSDGKITGALSSGEDITERKKTEEKIQQSEAELSAIYNYTPLAILLLDHERRIRKINKFALKFTDRREEEVFGIHGGEALRCLYSIKDPRGCGFSEQCQECIIRNTVLGTLKSKSPHINVEATLSLLPGSETDKVHLLVSTVPLNLEGEDRVLVSMIDITERKKAEQKLLESEEKYRTLINNIPGMIYRGNPDWTVEFITNSEVISGYIEEDFISQKFNWVDIIHPSDRKSILYESYLMSEKPMSISQIYRIITKEGDIRWVNDHKISYFDEKGNFCGVDGVVYDITARKIAEVKLKESEEKFRTIAEQTSLGLMIQLDGFIKFANSAVADMSEYSIQEINNWSVGDLIKIIHEEDIPIMNAKMITVKSDGFESSEQFELRLITKSGSLKWLEIIAKPIIYLGKKAVFATLIDTTAKKRLEKELKEISRLKSELLSRTSHELKTPLVSIKGYTDLLLRQHYEMLDIYTISVLNEIKQGCYRLESLIKDLLETSKLESEEIQLNMLEDDLAFLIKFCIRDLKGFVEIRKHKIILDIHDKIITMFEKERLYEVIMNLISNAIKYTPPNGQISIKSEIKNDNYIISISDNGIGLTKDEKEKIFKKFGKIERYGKGMDVDSEGTGLGLYISKKIIELHNGKIWVESEGRDQGCTFYFSIPIVKE